MSQDTWSKSTIAAILAIGIGSTASSTAIADDPKLEKCYGIVKKGMNECGTPTHTCEGLAPKDSDPAEWIYVLKGTCNKIVNGSTKAPSAKEAVSTKEAPTKGTGSSEKGVTSSEKSNSDKKK